MGEQLCIVIAEMKIDLFCLRESIRHDLLRVLARVIDAVPGEDEEIGHIQS